MRTRCSYWYRNGDVEVPLPGYGLTFHMTEASARYWTETVPTEEGAPGVVRLRALDLRLHQRLGRAATRRSW
jgi:hypothetical protein